MEMVFCLGHTLASELPDSVCTLEKCKVKETKAEAHLDKYFFVITKEVMCSLLVKLLHVLRLISRRVRCTCAVMHVVVSSCLADDFFLVST